MIVNYTGIESLSQQKLIYPSPNINIIKYFLSQIFSFECPESVQTVYKTVQELCRNSEKKNCAKMYCSPTDFLLVSNNYRLLKYLNIDVKHKQKVYKKSKARIHKFYKNCQINVKK